MLKKEITAGDLRNCLNPTFYGTLLIQCLWKNGRWFFPVTVGCHFCLQKGWLASCVGNLGFFSITRISTSGCCLCHSLKEKWIIHHVPVPAQGLIGCQPFSLFQGVLSVWTEISKRIFIIPHFNQWNVLGAKKEVMGMPTVLLGRQLRCYACRACLSLYCLTLNEVRLCISFRTQNQE